MNDTMKDNNLSRGLFPGLHFCEPTTSEMAQAAHAWITLCDTGCSPLPAGPSWGTGTVAPSTAIVFHRHLPNDVREEFHWHNGECTAHGFTVHVRNVRVVVSIEGEREDALSLAGGLAFFARHWLGISAASRIADEGDEAAYAADDHDPNCEAEDGESPR